MNHENFELRTHANVVEILHKDGRATGVKYIDTISGEEYIQPAEVVAISSYALNNVKLWRSSKTGKPYDPETGSGVVGKNYCYQTFGASAQGFFNDKKFNLYAGAGALGACLDDFNGDNFDHSDLNFLHGANISITQTKRRPIANNATPPDTPSWGAKFKDQSLKYVNSMLSVGAQGASLPF